MLECNIITARPLNTRHTPIKVYAANPPRTASTVWWATRVVQPEMRNVPPSAQMLHAGNSGRCSRALLNDESLRDLRVLAPTKLYTLSNYRTVNRLPFSAASGAVLCLPLARTRQAGACPLSARSLFFPRPGPPHTQGAGIVSPRRPPDLRVCQSFTTASRRHRLGDARRTIDRDQIERRTDIGKVLLLPAEHGLHSLLALP